MAEARSILDSGDIDRTITRLSHEILENGGGDGLAIVGIQRRGVDLAKRIHAQITEISGAEPLVGELDIALYRDDLGKIGHSPVVYSTEIPFDVAGTRIVLVDDVLFTGRSVRAAIDALMDFGRPRCIQLAVLVDRGHRELPIRADYVGKNVPTAIDEIVNVCLHERDGRDAVEVAAKNQEGGA